MEKSTGEKYGEGPEVYVKRAIGGITLNGTEYLIHAEGYKMSFQDEWTTRRYMRNFVDSDEQLDDFIYEPVNGEK